MSRFIQTQAIVVKRTNYADADRFVTLLTHDLGKISAIAKGVRRISSRKRPVLEPFNVAKVSLLTTKMGFMIGEAVLVEEFTHLKTSLSKIAMASQLLEIVEGLVAEEEAHPDIFGMVYDQLTQIDIGTSSKQVQISAVGQILESLGFGTVEGEVLLKNHIESITLKKLRSKQFYLQLPLH